MCIGDNPVARATPYLIWAIAFLIVTIFIHTLPIMKRLAKKHKFIFVVKIIGIIMSIILLLSAYSQYITRANCI